MDSLIEKLKVKHGLSEEQSKEIAETVREFFKEENSAKQETQKDAAGGPEEKTGYYTGDQTSSSPAASYIPDTALKNNEQLAKDKQSGFYEGNKKDY